MASCFGDSRIFRPHLDRLAPRHKGNEDRPDSQWPFSLSASQLEKIRLFTRTLPSAAATRAPFRRQWHLLVRSRSPYWDVGDFYDHFLTGIEGRPDFLQWVKQVYVARYPPPGQGDRFGPKSEVPDGFRPLGHQNYNDPHPMTRTELVHYHLSQSIALMGMKRRGEQIPAVRLWLDEELKQFIPDRAAEVVQFVGTVTLLAVD
jgi:hypothetical protein